jgi:hypothetical protein
MSNTIHSKDDIPEEFATEEEAGRFWDTHDSSEYLGDMDPVDADVRLETRHFEIEVDADVADALRKRATAEHVPASSLANDLLRKQLAVR